MRALRHPVLILLMLAVLVQGTATAWAFRATGSIAGFAFRSVDATEYFRIARNLVTRGVFSQSEGDPPIPDTWRTPGYPLLLAAQMIALGEEPARLVLAQQVNAIVNVILAYAVARRRLSQRGAMLVALAVLVEPYRVLDSMWLMSTTPFTTTLLLAWWAWDWADDGFRRNRHGVALAALAICGAILGAAVLIRPLGLPAPILAGAALLFMRLRAGTTRDRVQPIDRPRLVDRETTVVPGTGMRHGRLAAIVALLCFAVPCCLVTGTWMYRNYKVAGRFALSHQSGIVLAYFKAAEVRLWRDGESSLRYIETSTDPTQAGSRHRVWEMYDAELRSRLGDLPDEKLRALNWRNLALGWTVVDEFVVSDRLTDIGLRELAAAPGSTAYVLGMGMAELLTFPLTLAAKPPVGIPISRVKWWALGLAYSVPALMALLATVFVRGRRAAVFPFLVLGALLIGSTPQLDPRFRVPMFPMICFLAMRRPTRASDPSGVEVDPPC